MWESTQRRALGVRGDLLGVLVLVALGHLAACASAPRSAPTPMPPDESEDLVALLTSGDDSELHLRGEQVFVVELAPGGRAKAPPRQLLTWQEFTEWYVRGGGDTLPDQHPDEGYEINGWSGLECVRAGQACGRAPEPGSAPLIRVKIRFP